MSAAEPTTREQRANLINDELLPPYLRDQLLRYWFNRRSYNAMVASVATLFGYWSRQTEWSESYAARLGAVPPGCKGHG